MSRYRGTSPRVRRAWAIGAIAFFLLLCAGIAVSEWWAYNVNVPHYRAQMEKRAH
ncbi:MAG TPA: hypothetical protein VMD47_07670 [Candidatus Acidoferrales bacterium]|nr:hypothetical protein [Candidatus Acidoferrales bacterium]